MKIDVDAKSFVDAVQWVTKDYDKKDEKSYVRFFVDDDGVGYLSHNNLTSYMKSFMRVNAVDFSDDDVNFVDLALDGLFLQKLANAIGSSKDSITMSKILKDKKSNVEVKTSAGKFTVPMFDTVVGKDPVPVELGQVDDNDFFSSLLNLAKLCDPMNAGTQVFVGAIDVKLNTESKKVVLRATDRYALGEIILDFEPSENDDDTVDSLTDNSFLLPHASAVLVPPTKGISSSATLIGDDNDGRLRFGYSFADGRVALFSLTGSSTFPNTDNMKKKAFDTVDYQITVKKSDLVKAIKVVSSLSWDDDSIYFTISSDGLKISDVNNNNILHVEHSDIVYDAEEDYHVKFHQLVINEAFHPIPTTNIVLKWGKNSNAFILGAVTEDGKTMDNIFVTAVSTKN